jgi:hypothetical protein
MSAKICLLLALAAAPDWMVERARLCGQTRTVEDVIRFAPSDANPAFHDPNGYVFVRSSGSDGGVAITESGHVTAPVKTPKGWALGECITSRRTQTTTSLVEVTLSCEHANQKLREVETRNDGMVVTRVFNAQTGIIERVFTDRRLFDGKYVTRCERFAPDGGVSEVIEYGVRTGTGCAPIGAPSGPMPFTTFEYQRP